jgi:hypothetical protein
LISALDFLVCSRSGNAQFSSTVSESNSAANWNTSPNLRRNFASGWLRQREHVGAVDEDRAAVGAQQAHEVLDEHALAGARRADDHVDLAALDVEVERSSTSLGPNDLVRPRTRRCQRGSTSSPSGRRHADPGVDAITRRRMSVRK